MPPPVENTDKEPSPPPLPGAPCRSRRSAAESDRITRFASPNRFDTLDAPVSFLDRRPVATSPSVMPSPTAITHPGNSLTDQDNGNFDRSQQQQPPWRASVRSNLDSITRRAMPERCISHDWLITPLTGQAYQTSHSAMLTPTRTSTSQSLPVRRRPTERRSDGPPGLVKAMPRTASTVGAGALTGDRPEGQLRLSQLTASVQRLLAEREEERRRMSRQQFDLQIGRGRKLVDSDEVEISPRRAHHVHAARPTLWETPGKFEPERISQELVNDFFSSPLTESPENGDMVTVASMARQKEEEQHAKAVRSSSSHSLLDGRIDDTRVVTRTTIRSDATTSKRLTAPSDSNGFEAHEESTSPSSPETENNNNRADDYEHQLDELAGRMGLIERRPSTMERTAKKPVPPIADDSYRQSTAQRHMSEPDQVYEDSKKIHRRTRSAGGNSLLAFWRHISPRLSRRGRKSTSSTPEATRRESKERNRVPSGSKKSKSGDKDNESKKSVHSCHVEEREWDSVSSGQSRRPNSVVTTSSCPSPDSVFVGSGENEWVQPVVNKQVMASLERDRVKDPYQTFKSRNQQQQQQQQQNENTSNPRPSQLSIGSSTASSSSTTRSSSGIKSPTASVGSGSGPRYLSVAMSAFGYRYRRQNGNGTRPIAQSASDAVEEKEEERRSPGERLSCPPGLNDDVDGGVRPGPAGDEPEKEEVNGRVERPNSLSTRTASEDGRSSPTVTRRRAKPTEHAETPASRQTVCGCSHEDARPTTSAPNSQGQRLTQRRRRRYLSETTPRGGFTPTSPLNRSFDSQAANRSSLIMLAVGHSSPRPKSLSVTAGEETGAARTCENKRPTPVDAPSPDALAEEATVLDGRYFLRIVDAAERDIRTQIGVTEADLKEHGEQMCDEVAGILRTAVGKATLLVTDKFAQFRGLCHQNLAAGSSNGDHNGETVFATLSSDLEGFWEMVELQVADIRRMFKEIDSLRANSWRRPSKETSETDNGLATSRPRSSARPAVEARKKSAQRRPTAEASSKAPSSSSSTSAKAAAREEARKRLLAAKREAMARRKAEANNVNNNSDVIFV